MAESDNTGIRKGWKFKLEGEKSSLDYLIEIVNYNELYIFKDKNSGYYYLTSNALDEIIDAQEAKKKAEELLTLVNGGLTLAIDSGDKVKITQVYFDNGDGKDVYFAFYTV